MIDTPKMREPPVGTRGSVGQHINSELSEWKQIKKFVAACRRQWPGAMIVLRPDPNPAPERDADPHSIPSAREEPDHV